MPFIELNSLKINYIHVPKTGGTTIERWLSSIDPLKFHTAGVPAATRCTPQHFRMSDIRVLFGQGYFDYNFMTVRNPYDRIASEYRMRAAESGKGFWRTWPTFSHWLEVQIERSVREPFTLDNHLRPQWEFSGSDVEVFRLEDGMPSIIATVAKRIGASVPEKIGHECSSRDFPEPIVWDRVDILRVRERYARDFEEFHYDPKEI